MKDPSGSLLRRLVPGLVLGLLVFIGLAILGDIQKVSLAILRFEWKYLAIALSFTLLNFLLRFFKWHFHLGQTGMRRIAYWQSLRLFIAGFPLAIIPTKMAETLKGVWMMRQTGLPVGLGMSVVVAERISDILAMFLLTSLGIVAYPQYWLVFTAWIVFLLIVIVISQIRPATIWLLEQGERSKPLNKISQTGREIYEGSIALFRPGSTLLATCLGVIAWFGEGIGFYFIMLGLGIQPTQSLLAMAVFILSFSTLMGMISGLPGGLGVTEVIIAGMLTFALQQDPAIATVATLLIRLATLWFGVVVGMIVWAFSPDMFGVTSTRQPIPEV